MSQDLLSLLTAPFGGQAFSAEAARAVAPFAPQQLTGLGAAAASAGIRQGVTPFTCGIINAKSGRCSEDCAFCAQSRYHTTASPVYPLVSEETLYKHANQLAGHGVNRMGIVTSGGGLCGRDFDTLCRYARRLREKVGIGLCASFGMLTAQQALCLKEAGFGSYHHNLETARSYYPALCSTHSYDVRIDTVRIAKAAGLRVCSGGLFGLGESWEARIELSATLQELDVDSIPVNFLIPIVGTRLEGADLLPPEEALSIVTMLRLMHPARDIVICGGRGLVLGEWDRVVFFAGANGLMVGDYLTAKGNPLERDMTMLKALGVACG